MSRRRDDMIVKVVNWVLRRFVSAEYRAVLTQVIRDGMDRDDLRCEAAYWRGRAVGLGADRDEYDRKLRWF